MLKNYIWSKLFSSIKKNNLLLHLSWFSYFRTNCISILSLLWVDKSKIWIGLISYIFILNVFYYHLVICFNYLLKFLNLKYLKVMGSGTSDFEGRLVGTYWGNFSFFFETFKNVISKIFILILNILEFICY
jgi:hypothetical protein